MSHLDHLDPDGAPLSAIPPATRMAVAAAEGDRVPRPATSLIDIKQQSDRVRVTQPVDDQTNDSDDGEELSPHLKRNHATNQNINSANSATQSQNLSPNMASSLAALPQASTTPTPTPSATPGPVQHPNVRRNREGGSSRNSSGRRVPKEPTSGALPANSPDPPRERRTKFRTVPHLPHGPAEPAPPTLMYWSRAPVYGHLPSRSMRAHTVTLVENTAWLFGGCDDKGCAKDVWTFDVGAFAPLAPCTL